MPTVKEGLDIEEKDRDDEDNYGPLGHSSHTSPCVAWEFKAAVDTIQEAIEETQPWYIFCIYPNDSQLPN